MTSISPDISAVHADIASDSLPSKDNINQQICYDFIRAIQKDNVEELKKILQESTTDDRELLLNGAIQEEATFTNCPKIVRDIAVNRAIHMAVLEQSFGCFQYLLESGVDVLPKENDDNNILHYLVYSYALNRNEMVSKMYEKIIHNCGIMERRELLLMKNKSELTPLELAADLACSDLFLLYLYTEGVHRKIVKNVGKAVTNEFTFAKKDGCKGNSFLWQLANCRSDDSSSDIVAMVENVVVQEYVRKKFWRIMPIGILWFVIRVFPLVASLNDEFRIWTSYANSICVNTNMSNLLSFSKWLDSNNNDTDYIHLVCYPVYGFSMIFFDIGELLYLCVVGKKSIVKAVHLLDDRVVNAGFYRVDTFVLGICILCIGLMEATGKAKPGTWKEQMVTILHLFNLVITFLSILYFVQLWPVLGYFMIGFQKMLAAVFRFVMLQAIVLFVFSTLFTYVRVYSCDTSEKVCERILNVYDTFIMMLNMVSDIVPSDTFCDAWGEICLKFLHVTYVFVVAIMVINYLIAVMSSAYSNFSFLQNSVQPLHRLHFALTIERRLEMFEKLIPPKFRMSRGTEDVLVVTEVCRDFEVIHSLTLPKRVEEKLKLNIMEKGKVNGTFEDPDV